MGSSCGPFTHLAGATEDRKQLATYIVILQVALAAIFAVFLEIYAWILQASLGEPLFGLHPWKVGVVTSFVPLLLDASAQVKLLILRRTPDKLVPSVLERDPLPRRGEE